MRCHKLFQSWGIRVRGYGTLSFTYWDFSNIRRDLCATLCHHDVDLVVERFESCKEKMMVSSIQFLGEKIYFTSNIILFLIDINDISTIVYYLLSVGRMNNIFWTDQ